MRVERSAVALSLLREPPPRIAKLLDGLRAAGTELVAAPDDQIAALTGGRDIGALLGLVRLPPPPALQELREGPLLVAVEVSDPGNVGALVRTAHASGASGFVAVGCSDPWHPRAVRISLGSLFRTPVRHEPQLLPLLDGLRGLGLQLVAATSAGGEPLPRARFERRVALLVGSEARGLPDEARARVDLAVTIPMGQAVDSYSVNAAAAILLYEIRTSRERVD